MTERIAHVIELELAIGTAPQIVADIIGHPLSVVIRGLRVEGYGDLADRLHQAGQTA